LKLIAAARAETSPTAIHSNCRPLGMPRAASTAPVKPKGRVRMECSHLIISSVVPRLRSMATEKF
jgi:hypothetical protein